MSTQRIMALAYSAAGLGGVALLYRGGAALLSRLAAKTKAQTIEAVATGSVFDARLTGYWPFTAAESEKKMEGGVEGAAAWRGRRVVDPSTGKRVKLHTLEDAQAGRAPFVSVSADPEIFPFGQRLEIDEWPGVAFRVVDTGGHFTGLKKLQRVANREPLDITVDSKFTKIKPDASVRIPKGDHWGKPGDEVVASKFKGQEVVVGSCGLDYLGSRTPAIGRC